MSKHRPHHYTKSDSNQAEIVADLRKLGFDVDIVSGLKGIYDIVVSGYKRLHFLHGQARSSCSVRVEIKNEKGKLNETEVKYWEKQKHVGSLIVARTTEDVLEWFGR